MIKQVCITDAGGPRFYTHADFPLAIGSHPGADIHITSDNLVTTTAFLIIIVNRTYIEPEDKTAKITINNEQVLGQQEIQHNDILQIEGSTFHCEHIGDTFSISLYDDQAHLVTNNHDAASHGELIEPISLSSATTSAQTNKKIARLLSILGLLVFAMLALVITYVFTAKTLLIEVEPTPDGIALSGKIWPLKVKGRYLVQPGNYLLEVIKSGYYPIQKEIKVTKYQSQSLSFTLQKKPGYLNISSVPKYGVQILINDQEHGVTPIEKLELAAGTYSLQAYAKRYQPYSTQLVIEGKEQSQNINIELLPNWAEVSINSKPAKAEVWLNGINKGITPLTLDLLAGNYNVELRHTDYLPYTKEFLVIANKPLALPLVELFKNPSHLVITSIPSKAIVSIAGIEQGITPLTVQLNPNIDHALTLTKPGYRAAQQTVTLKPGEQQTLSAKLEAILGTVMLNVDPQDSEVFINGKFVGSGTLKLSLPSNTQRLEIRKSGYEVYEKMITPTADSPQVINVMLNRITSATNIDKPSLIRTSQGQELKLIFGGKFSMGASRREQGRRSNETLHTVELQRPFYIGTTEVTNAQFAKFRATHSSGTYKSNDLSGPNLPVTNVNWEDAARYCNWLSEKDGLEKVYQEQNGALKAVHPVPSGYRLPTESEWEWVARMQSNGNTQRYGWGNTFPPIQVTGNYADKSASGILDIVIDGYDDGFATAAPIGSYRANYFGIFDLGGNVAEWCHDYHSIYPSLSDEVFIDPVGPASGSNHVIRGASWKRGDISSTRLSYRDRDDKKRIDVGFRIAKYID